MRYYAVFTGASVALAITSGKICHFARVSITRTILSARWYGTMACSVRRPMWGGPRKAGVVAAICWPGGLAVAALGVYLHQLWLLWGAAGA